MSSDHEAHPGVRRKDAKTESTGTITPAMPTTDNNWGWARRIEASDRIAEVALRKELAAVIKALNGDR
jgi:hypothetical protein